MAKAGALCIALETAVSISSRGTMVGGDPRRAKIHGIGKLNVGYTEAKMLT